ncbi:Yip1 family protein [Streptacidiphilus sp. N1-3]|uniref:Yip1 family protein n=1 Tax=Streptacidiphilus alkalitolerans TaxID=3342712 RepID=A0ABV6X7C3_9ACTN
MGTNGFRLRRSEGSQRNGASPRSQGAPPPQHPQQPPYRPQPPSGLTRDDDNPGSTRAFSVDSVNSADGYGPGYGPAPDGPGPGYGPAPDGTAEESPTAARGNVTTYRAGQRHPQVSGVRLAWRPLLACIYRHPDRTFAQMRWHQVWAPALIVSAVYGALAVFGFADTRSQVLDATFSIALTIIISSAVGIIVAGLMFGGVTHVLARRLGGDGAWAPTIGLSMIITWTTDAPRLLFSFFLASNNAFVQLLGWASWLLCAGLLTSMVRQLHDLPWGKAAGAAALQLIALLILIKLPILG